MDHNPGVEFQNLFRILNNNMIRGRWESILLEYRSLRSYRSISVPFLFHNLDKMRSSLFTTLSFIQGGMDMLMDILKDEMKYKQLYHFRRYK